LSSGIAYTANVDGAGGSGYPLGVDGRGYWATADGSAPGIGNGPRGFFVGGVMTDRQEEAALRRAIFEEPADDAPRMVYADWLDEHPTPARTARAALIRLQVARAEGGRRRTCTVCKGDREIPAGEELPGYSTEPGPLIAAVICPSCDGAGWAVDVSVERQLAVAESLKKEEAILKRWGAGWLPKAARGRRCQSIDWKGETVVVTDSNGRYTFDRGWPAFVRIDTVPWLRNQPTLAELGLGLRFRSILAACPVERVTVYGPAHFENLTFKFDRLAGGAWSAYVGPLVGPDQGGTASGSALIAFDSRRDLVRGVADFVAEFLPMARPRAYSQEYYEQGATGEPVIPGIVEPWNQDLIDRDAEARNNVDMPHER
jgi:uncharacterized protein (TIGR02996 family)